LGGLRIGWLACQNTEFLEKTLFYKQSLSVCSSSIDDWLATLAVKNSSLLRRRTKSIALENLNFINQCIEKTQNKLIWTAPSAGCVAFPSLREDISITDLANSFLQNHSTMLIPGECFSHSPINHFRLGYGQKNFRELFKTFCTYLEMHYH
jgi:aspartate/methionine/tyrosine aminotransferase